jgi:hypothetical protein
LPFFANLFAESIPELMMKKMDDFPFSMAFSPYYVASMHVLGVGNTCFLMVNVESEKRELQVLR